MVPILFPSQSRTLVTSCGNIKYCNLKHIRYCDMSLFIPQKPTQSEAAVCKKQSTPFVVPQELKACNNARHCQSDALV